ncbi:MAG: hypothetical protein RLZZ254_1072, partial [Actinomycetota bacterium]
EPDDEGIDWRASPLESLGATEQRHEG